MADIAQKLSVSTVTVSKALNDKPGVSEEVREKIKETALQMGYKAPSPLKAARFGLATGNIGVIIPSRFLDSYSFYWAMYQNLLSHLREREYYGVLEILTDDEELESSPPRMLVDGKVDGLILIGQLEECYLEMLRAADIPLMFLDSYNGKSGGSSIISDGYYGMYAVVSYLINMGHRNIYFVGRLDATSSINDRYYGYSRAMNENGLRTADYMVIPDRDENGNLSIVLPDTLPSAFACNCDLTAYELTGLLKQRGLSVPNDISVAGFDDFIGLSGPRSLDITTYAVDINAMTKAAVDNLFQKMIDKDYRPTLKVITGRLIIKDSVRAIQHPNIIV
jgi:DNA-binding LacI/PurR family transcriptional regulator